MLKNVFGFLGKSKEPDVVVDESKPSQETVDAPVALEVPPAPEAAAVVEGQEAPVAVAEAEAAPEVEATPEAEAVPADAVAPEAEAAPIAEATPEPVAEPETAPEPVAEPKPVAKAPSISDEEKKALADRYRSAYTDSAIVDFTEDTSSIDNADLTIAAAYKQVFGNAYLMESERLPEAESQLRGGEISVSDFIRQLAKSDRYRSLFWDKYTNVTAIELNFKHLLGRAPESYAEISQHIQILAEGGFEAEIDSYIDSDEYLDNFGNYRVPHPRGYDTQVGKALLGYTRAFSMMGMACSSDKSSFVKPDARVQGSLFQDGPGDMPVLRPIPAEAKNVPQPPKPRVPKELKGIANELWESIRRRQALRPY